MTRCTSWMHGHAVVVENPDAFHQIGRAGWGADLDVKMRESSWLHLPIPTPSVIDGARVKVREFYLLFQTEHCELRSVHVYDGASKVQSFDGLRLTGSHLSKPDTDNTFVLEGAHTVKRGMGISFLLQAHVGFDTVIPVRLIVASGGADFYTRPSPVGELEDVVATRIATAETSPGDVG